MQDVDRLRSVAPEPQAGHRLSDLCMRIALEIELLRQVGARIEQSLCSAADAWGVDGERMRDLQQLDYLLQHLGALREFVAAMATHGASAVELDISEALERIRLGALKSRLGGGPQDVQPEEEPDAVDWL